MNEYSFSVLFQSPRTCVIECIPLRIFFHSGIKLIINFLILHLTVALLLVLYSKYKTCSHQCYRNISVILLTLYHEFTDIEVFEILYMLLNMCIAIVCFPGCDVNLIFLIKPFFYMTKMSRQKFNIFGTKRAFKVK